MLLLPASQAVVKKFAGHLRFLSGLAAAVRLELRSGV